MDLINALFAILHLINLHTWFFQYVDNRWRKKAGGIWISCKNCCIKSIWIFSHIFYCLNFSFRAGVGIYKVVWIDLLSYDIQEQMQ